MELSPYPISSLDCLRNPSSVNVSWRHGQREEQPGFVHVFSNNLHSSNDILVNGPCAGVMFTIFDHN